jgi:hypothetical protein
MKPEAFQIFCREEAQNTQKGDVLFLRFLCIFVAKRFFQ